MLLIICRSILFFEIICQTLPNKRKRNSVESIKINQRESFLNQTILIVEDEKEIADTLTYALASEGFKPHWVANCESALESLNNKACEFGIFDVGLPDGNGFELLKTIRQAGNNMPVLFLTARGEEIDRIVGLEIGADDYVTKPFSPREVVTRVKVILKRLDKHHVQGVINSNTHEFVHKAEQRVIHYDGTAMELTRAEYELMTAFIAQPNRVFSRRQLIENIWSSNHPSDDRAIDTHIKTLRAKLKTLNPHKEFIVTHRGFGYSLEV